MKTPKTIAIITPRKKWFDAFIRENMERLEGLILVWVSNIDQARGIEKLHSVELAHKYWEVPQEATDYLAHLLCLKIEEELNPYQDLQEVTTKSSEEYTPITSEDIFSIMEAMHLNMDSRHILCDRLVKNIETSLDHLPYIIQTKLIYAARHLRVNGLPKKIWMGSHIARLIGFKELYSSLEVSVREDWTLYGLSFDYSTDYSKIQKFIQEDIASERYYEFPLSLSMGIVKVEQRYDPPIDLNSFLQ